MNSPFPHHKTKKGRPGFYKPEATSGTAQAVPNL
jgi:hypothetical protein